MNKKQRAKKRIQEKTTAISDVWTSKNEQTVTDELGSYTGTPKDGGNPVQDADDL